MRESEEGFDSHFESCPEIGCESFREPLPIVSHDEHHVVCSAQLWLLSVYQHTSVRLGNNRSEKLPLLWYPAILLWKPMKREAGHNPIHSDGLPPDSHDCLLIVDPAERDGRYLLFEIIYRFVRKCLLL